MQILEVLNVAATEGSGPKSRRERSDPNRRHTLVTCACAAALAGLDTLARKYRGKLPLLCNCYAVSRNLTPGAQLPGGLEDTRSACAHDKANDSWSRVMVDSAEDLQESMR